jgi:hypothetical protein
LDTESQSPKAHRKIRRGLYSSSLTQSVNLVPKARSRIERSISPNPKITQAAKRRLIDP